MQNIWMSDQVSNQSLPTLTLPMADLKNWSGDNLETTDSAGLDFHNHTGFEKPLLF